MNFNPEGDKRPQLTGIAFGYCLCAAVVGFLVFFNLGGRMFWGDEAETGMLAKNVLRFGVPRVNDGTNDITLHGDKIDANPAGVWTWSPWLQEYLAAGSLGIFGPTT